MLRSSSKCALVVALLVFTASDCRASGGGDGVDDEIERLGARMRHDRPSSGGRTFDAPAWSHDVRAVGLHRGHRGSNRWQWSVTPFVWVPAIDGTLAVGGQEVDVDSSISDTAAGFIENFQFAAMLRFEARKCEWSIIGDFSYLGLGNDGEVDVPGAGEIDFDWDMDMLIAEAFVGYRFAEVALGCPSDCFTPNVTFDAIAGLRYYYLGLDIDLDPGPGFDGDKHWLDPAVGLRALFHVTPTLSFNVFANVGGFGVGSDLSWQLIAGVDWKVARCVSLNAGWMVLDVDFESGNFEYDVTMSGPYLAATFRF